MKKVLALSVFIYCINLAFGQNANPANWMASANQMPGNLKAFQENKGQFKNLINDWTITYGANCGGVEVLFTSKGVLYYLPERVKMTNEKTNGVNRREPEAEKEQEAENETKYKIIYHKVAVEWENANTNPVIEARDETPYLFGKIDPDKATGIDNISGFKKLVYHNVYPGIDIEFTFHPDKGIKYTIKVKPGYDASVLKMRYLGPDGLNLDAKGNIHIKTPIGDIIDHSPLTMQNGKQVNSSFQKVSGNEIKFTVAKSGNSSALVIDPWVVFPISPAKAEPMDIGMDAANNVYVLEWDSSAMYIQKYLSTGALSWTYDLSQYGRNTAISDLAVDPLGNTYTPQSWYYTNAGGGSYAMLCLSSTGTLKYFYNTYNNSQGIVFETWGTAYSPVTGNLIECGAPNILSNQTGIINSANGNFLGPIHTDTLFDEIAAVTIGSNGVMYGLTGNKCFCNSGAGSYTNTLVAFNISGVTPALMWSKRIPTYNFQDFQQKNLAGIAYNGISTGAGSIYTSDGLKLYRFNINTGSLMDSALIPGGRDAGKLINSGIAVDTMCGYVYVGSRTDVQVYTTSLIPVTTLACPGLVNDIAYGNGLVSACGSTSSIDSSFVVQFTGQTCLSVTVAVTSNVNCNGGSEGSATVTATGGKTPYTYSWAPSGGSSSTATGLSAGTYTVTVKDNNGVTRTVSVTITQPAALADATPTINSNVACYGGNGSATAAIPTGGTSPYTYAWNGGATSTDATNTVLSAGTYTVNITDANGCIVNSTGTVTITQPAALSDSIPTLNSNAACFGGNGGATAATPTGGTAPYTYAWNGGTTSTNATNSALSAGTYTVNVTDANGCTVNSAGTVTITQPAALADGTPVINSNVACFGGDGSATAATPTGGTSPYTYAWNGGTTSTDAANTALSAGTYTVNITDAHGCIVNSSSSVTITQPATSSSDGTPTLNFNAACFGDDGSATAATPTGGTSPYTYAWNGGTTSTNATNTALSAGTYTVNVTDANGCMVNSAGTVTITQPPVLTDGTPTLNSNIACHGSYGSATAATPTGGTSPYTYAWNGGATSTDATNTALSAGTYTVNITDANGCMVNSAGTVTITQPAALVESIPTQYICPDECVTLSGGTPQAGVIYHWLPHAGLSSPHSITTTACPLVTTTYTLTAREGSCEHSVTAIVVVKHPRDCRDRHGVENGSSDKDTLAMEQVNVYPNPANSSLNIETQLGAGEVENICLYNTFGQQVRCTELSNNITTISISNLAAGIYFYRVTDTEGNLVHSDKVVIVH